MALDRWCPTELSGAVVGEDKSQDPYQQSRHRRRSPTRAVVVPKLIHVQSRCRCKLKKHTRYYSSRVSAREDSAEPEQAIRPILRM